MSHEPSPGIFDFPAATYGEERWIKLLPAGRFRLRDGRGGDLNTGDLTSMQEIVNRTRSYFGSTDIMVDYDHELVRAAKHEGRAEAAGWITALEARADGIYGRVEWTATAADKIASKAYRYISPWFQTLKDGRVYKLINAALVNTPALDLIAANMELPSMEKPTLEAQLREILSLASDADEATMLEAVRTLAAKTVSASASPDPSAFVPMAVFTQAVAEANSLRAGVAEDEAHRLVDAAIAAGAMIPALEPWAVELCRVNLPAFRSFLASTGPALMTIYSGASQGEAARRASLQVDPKTGLNEMEHRIAASLDLSAAEFSAAKGGAPAVFLDDHDRTRGSIRR